MRVAGMDMMELGHMQAALFESNNVTYCEVLVKFASPHFTTCLSDASSNAKVGSGGRYVAGTEENRLADCKRYRQRKIRAKGSH